MCKSQLHSLDLLQTATKIRPCRDETADWRHVKSSLRKKDLSDLLTKELRIVGSLMTAPDRNSHCNITPHWRHTSFRIQCGTL